MKVYYSKTKVNTRMQTLWKFSRQPFRKLFKKQKLNGYKKNLFPKMSTSNASANANTSTNANANANANVNVNLASRNTIIIAKSRKIYNSLRTRDHGKILPK